MTPLRGLEAACWKARFYLDPIMCMMDAHRRYGQLGAIGNVLPNRTETLHVLALGPRLNQLVLNDPELFLNPEPKPEGTALSRIRWGLISMNGQKHRAQRKLLWPTFSTKAVERYARGMADVILPIVEQWPSGGAIEVVSEMRRLALRLSSHLLFGREARTRMEMLGDMVQEFILRSASIGVHLCPRDWPLAPFRALCRHAEHVEQTLLRLLHERSEMKGDAVDLFDLLVRAHQADPSQMSETDLVGQAFVLVAASFENVAATLVWTLFLLAQHPRVAQELRDELDGQDISLQTVNELPLLDAVVKESMRILPAVAYLVRVANQATAIDALPLKAGDRIALSPYVTHHLPELYAQPECFQPERWSHIKPLPHEYIPFGTGTRFCIGSHLAIANIKFSLALILKRWCVSLVPGQRVDRMVRVTMRPKHALLMRVQPRDRAFSFQDVVGNIHDMVSLTAPTRFKAVRTSFGQKLVRSDEPAACPFAQAGRHLSRPTDVPSPSTAAATDTRAMGTWEGEHDT